MAQSDELQPLPTPEAFIDQFAFSLLYVLPSVIGFHAQCLARLVCSQFGSKVLPDSADAAVNAFCLTSCPGSKPPRKSVLVQIIDYIGELDLVSVMSSIENALVLAK